jgi:peptidoglycan/LPS O-acetylase OafA/YrhL
MSLPSTDAREIRKFGVVAFVLFGVLFAIALFRHKYVPGYFLGALSFLGLCFLLLPGPLLPIYTRWLKIAHFVGTVMTCALLTLAYYLAITPMALIHRLFKGSPLPESPDKSASTYWVSRSEPAQPRERFIKRY